MLLRERASPLGHRGVYSIWEAGVHALVAGEPRVHGEPGNLAWLPLPVAVRVFASFSRE